MLLTEYRVSERRACAIVLLERTVYRDVGRPRDDRAVRQRIKEIATIRVRYGFERIQVLLRCEGCATFTNELAAFRKGRWDTSRVTNC